MNEIDESLIGYQIRCFDFDDAHYVLTLFYPYNKVTGYWEKIKGMPAFSTECMFVSKNLADLLFMIDKVKTELISKLKDEMSEATTND